MHTVFALLCFVVVIHWLIFPYPSGLLHWHCGNLTIAPAPAKQPWWIWINTSCEFIMNDCITTTKQRTTRPCAYFLEYTVFLFEEGHRPCQDALDVWQMMSRTALAGICKALPIYSVIIAISKPAICGPHHLSLYNDSIKTRWSAVRSSYHDNGCAYTGKMVSL